ncbi:MAG: hypothetical protein ABII79_08295 [bacterium]
MTIKLDSDRHKQRIRIVAAVGIILLCGLMTFSCGDDEIIPPEIEVFSGELALANIEQREPHVYPDTDQVTLTIEGSSYSLNHDINMSNLCNSGGVATGFGTNSLSLTPTSFSSGNCDTIRIPQGKLKAVFLGDSLLLGPDTVYLDPPKENWIYHFRLRKT